MRLVVVVGRHWPLSSGLGRPIDGPALPHSTDGRRPRCAPSEPQPTTVSPNGGRADRSRTRESRYTPANLSHAALSSIRGSRDARPVAATPEPTAGEAVRIRRDRALPGEAAESPTVGVVCLYRGPRCPRSIWCACGAESRDA